MTSIQLTKIIPATVIPVVWLLVAVAAPQQSPTGFTTERIQDDATRLARALNIVDGEDNDRGSTLAIWAKEVSEYGIAETIAAHPVETHFLLCWFEALQDRNSNNRSCFDIIQGANRKSRIVVVLVGPKDLLKSSKNEQEFLLKWFSKVIPDSQISFAYSSQSFVDQVFIELFVEDSGNKSCTDCFRLHKFELIRSEDLLKWECVHDQ
jgi:hypothetical protein